MNTGGHISGLLPVGPLALHLLGILRAHEGRYEEAEEAFLRAAEADPEMAGSYVELGLVCACQGEYRRMVEALRKAILVGQSGVRAYLGERPLGDLSGEKAAGAGGGREAARQLVSAVEYLSEGRDHEATALPERSLVNKSDDRLLAVALLTLAYLLMGDDVGADDSGVRRVAARRRGGGGGR